MDLSKREQLFKAGYYNLDRNENLDRVYLKQLDEIFKKCSSLVSVYPDYPKFTLRLASFFGVSPHQIIPTCGCTEAIKIAGDFLIDTGGSVLVLDPTYQSAVSYFETLDANIHTIPADSTMDEIVEYINKNDIEFFYLCNPNNPTGGVFELDDLKKLANCNAYIFVDESYAEFCLYGTTAKSLIHTNPNIIIGRSFSKAWGLAGLRVGLLIGNEETIAQLSPFKLKAGVNSVAVRIISELMDNYKLISESVERIQIGDDYIRRLLLVEGHSVDNAPHVNFILSDIPSQLLDDNRILYKTVGDRQCFTSVPAEQAQEIFKFL